MIIPKDYGKKNKSLDQITQIQNQIANTQARLNSVGMEKDPRNWFEKMTNLPDKQNFLFDIFDLIQRPFQGVTNVVDSFIDPNDYRSKGSAFMEGFTGKSKIYGSDLLENLGVEGATKHVGGFGIDLLLDPLTYIPGAQIAKGTQMAGRGAKALGRGAKAIAPAPVKKIIDDGADWLDSAFAKSDKSRTMKTTLDGGLSDDLVKLDRELTNAFNDLNSRIIDDVSGAVKTAGATKANIDDIGVQASRLMEEDLIPSIRRTEYKLPDGSTTSSMSDVEGMIGESAKALKALRGETTEANLSYAKRISEAEGEINSLTKELKHFDGDDFNYDRIQEQIIKKTEDADKLRIEQGIAISDLVKQTDAMSGTLGALKKALKNPVTVEELVPIVRREASQDPNLLKAVEQMVQSNKVLVEVAEGYGIEIPEMAGYMAHILTKDYLDLIKKDLSSGKRRIGANEHILDRRKYQDTVENINDDFRKKYNYDMFEPNAFIATALGQKRLVNYILAKRAQDTVLGNPNFARPIKKGESPILTKNETTINSADYRGFNVDNIIAGTETLTSEGQRYIITKGAKRLLENYQMKTTDEGIKGFLNKVTEVNNFWKKSALFSAGFHIRNQVGNMFNMWISDVPLTDIVKYHKEAMSDINNVRKGAKVKYYDEFRQQGLRESSIFEQEFKSGNAENAIKRMTKTKSGMNMRNPFEVSRDIGTSIDEHARYALYKFHRTKGKSPEDSAKLVREVLFDYSDLTPFEKGIKNYAIPFYTWSRNNIPFQLKNFFNNPVKYSNTDKLRDMAFGLTGMEEDLAPEWLQESFAFPVMGDGKGSGKFLGLNLPLADLSQLSNPLKMIVDSSMPTIKTPMELGTNHNFFTGKPIQEFEGQKGSIATPFKDIPVSKNIEHLWNQLGAFRNFSNHTTRLKEGDVLNLVTGNMLKNMDVDQAQYFKLMEVLNELQDLMQVYKQEHGELPPLLKAGGR